MVSQITSCFMGRADGAARRPLPRCDRHAPRGPLSDRESRHGRHSRRLGVCCSACSATKWAGPRDPSGRQVARGGGDAHLSHSDCQEDQHFPHCRCSAFAASSRRSTPLRGVNGCYGVPGIDRYRSASSAGSTRECRECRTRYRRLLPGAGADKVSGFREGPCAHCYVSWSRL